MEPLSGPFVVACALLATAGIAKLWRPAPTAAALRTAGLPGSDVLARALGTAELAVGVAGLSLETSPAAGAVAAAYLGFAAFVALLLARRERAASCGCFGRADTPASLVHLLVNLTAAAVAIAVAVAPVGSLRAILADQPLGGATFVVYAALGTYLAYLTLTALPRSLVDART